MDNVPIREYIDARLADERRHQDAWFAHLDRRMDAADAARESDRKHKHGGYVPWLAYVPSLAGLVTLILVTS